MKRLVVLLLCFGAVFSQSSKLISVENKDATLEVIEDSGLLRLNVTYKADGKTKLLAEIRSPYDPETSQPCTGLENCLTFENDVRLHISESSVEGAFEVVWSSSNISRQFKDCFDLTLAHWYGGPEWHFQDWPIEKLVLKDLPFVTQNESQIAVAEPYWLNSLGAYVYVDEKVPLFVDQNADSEGYVCFSAKAETPYLERDRVILKYSVVALGNARDAQLHAVNNFLGKPTGHPSDNLIQKPIFSTWARYYRDINDDVLIQFANEIVNNGFSGSQLEIDDQWEDCYGALTFTKTKFPNIIETIKTIHSLNLSTSLWVHPFANIDCEDPSTMGLANDFFLKDHEGRSTTMWWNSPDDGTRMWDFSNSEVRTWYFDKLNALREEVGLDGYKFDAGEVSWAPWVPVTYGDPELKPNSLTSDYIRTCALFGNNVEVRSAYRTQDLSIFLRMIDKDSLWTNENGLYTLVTTLLQMNIDGYTLVLPDMVGGNGYNGIRPDAELFIRWLQANTFMPAIQFSVVPWDFKDFTELDVVEVARNFVDLHTQFAPDIFAAFNRSITLGYPVNPPIWFIDPDYEEALACDDEYLLGENILVAPVLKQGERSRDIVLPNGLWRDGNNGTIYDGRQVLKDYGAPLDVLPYFIRARSGSR